MRMEGASARWLGRNQMVGYTNLFQRVGKALQAMRSPGGRAEHLSRTCTGANHGNREIV
jgi:hypothetical protein